MCQDNIVSPTILEVIEPETCNYIFKIATLELCDINALVTQKTVIFHPISCLPSLRDDEFSKYMTGLI